MTEITDGKKYWLVFVEFDGGVIAYPSSRVTPNFLSRIDNQQFPGPYVAFGGVCAEDEECAKAWATSEYSRIGNSI